MKNERYSNIELLRIISIIMIIISHYTVHNGINNADLPLGINRFILEISTLGNIGTIIFVLISGYFLTLSDKISFKKILKLLFQIMFYSIVIYFILIILNYKSFSISEMIKNCLPITFKRYWFASAYFLLYILTPFINKLFNVLTKKEAKQFILLNIIIFSLLSTFTGQDYYGNELVQFVMFYSIGSYIRRYPENIMSNNRYKLFIISSILIILSIITLDILGRPFSNHSTYFLKRTSILTILQATSMLCIFIKMKKFNNKLINNISTSTFAVYLISDNKYIRPILWNNIFKNNQFVSSNLLLPHMILAVIAIMLICVIIELLRKYLIEKTLFKLLDKRIEKIEIKIRDLFSRD